MSLRVYIPLYFIIIFLQLQVICIAVPIYENEDYKRSGGDTLWSNTIFIAVFGVICGICLILAIGVCVCCDKNRFKFPWNRRRVRRVLRSNNQNGFLAGNHEISIFPPPGAEQYLTSSTSNIHFEPLPDITSQLNVGSRPPRLSASVASNLNEDWFAEPYKNFPRNQLQYVRKLGSGWFGQVLEGRAIGVDTDHTSTVITKGPTSKATPVVVKALREDASSQEQALFLQELIPYRDLNHANILKIVAYCIETQPLLVLLQYCPKGDLKGVLKRDRSLTDITLLKMAENVSAGLSHMHQNNFIHTDLAARNCVVENDLNVKIGDYGFSVETYQNEYYLAENVALPIRWCAPETLRCTETTIETIELTKAANVWSFGVLLWEIFTRGKLPYDDLDEDGVIQKVLLERSSTLRVPLQTPTFCSSKINEILTICFANADHRPFMPYLHSLLRNLEACLNESSTDREFEERWNQLSENSRNADQHNLVIEDTSFDMRFESNFTPRDVMGEKGSPTPSLRNLHGSAEDLDTRIAVKFGSALPSWLGLEPGQAMDSFTEEISDAIQRLDEALSEDHSQSTTSVSSPEKTSFRLGSDSLVLNPPGVHRTLSDGDEENLTMRLEQGDFSELVRLKSQSVQDFMRLTVVDDGSDCDKTSQPGSLLGDYSAPPCRPQEKTFSSESNLKEAVRDAGFMVELEKLQAGHKFSIISEASKEGMPSIEGVQSTLGDSYSSRIPEEDYSHHSSEEDSILSTSEGIENVDFQKDFKIFPENEGSNSLNETELPGKRHEVFQETCQASPDCILSSRGGLSSAPLPDIVSHDTNIVLVPSSDSSLDENKTTNARLSEEKSIEFLVRNNKDQGEATLPHLYIPSSQEVKKTQSEDTKEQDCTNPQNLISSDSNPTYSPEKVVLGEKVVIGALDDYSLEPFKPAKSNYIDLDTCDDGVNVDQTSDWLNITNQKVGYDNDNNNILIFNSENSKVELPVSKSSCRIDNFNNLESSILSGISKTEEQSINPFKMNGMIYIKGIGETEKQENISANYNLNNKSLDNNSDYKMNLKPSVDPTPLKFILPNHETQQRDDSSHAHFSDETFLPTEAKSTNHDEQNNEILLGKNCEKSANYSEDSETSMKMKPEDTAISDPSKEIICSMEKFGIAASDSEKAAASCTEMRSGEFWERQMVAWQEAAEQTRALLQAAHTEEGIGPHQGSEEDFLDISRSPGSSQKSPFSSTDRLDDTDEDEGTYVSYDTTDDDDAVRFNHDDILALRSELHLKLPDVTENQEKVSDDEPGHDHVYINYKSGCALSPIKEEDHHADFFEMEGENSSIEFTEGNRAPDGAALVPPLTLDILDGDTTEEAKAQCEFTEETKDSLILEDLDCEGAAPAIVGPIVPTSSSEDLLLVDTATNQVMLINSERPQSLIAFHVEKQNSDPDPFSSAAALLSGNFDDDVAPESLPYESNSTDLISASSYHKSEGSLIDGPLPVVDIVDENEAPHYQSYFTSALSSISYPTPSLERNDAFESADHVSLPYEVNFPLVHTQSEVVNEQPGKEDFQVVPHSKNDVFPVSTKIENEQSMVDVSPISEDTFVTLSFLGRLYSAEESNGHVESDEKIYPMESGRNDILNTKESSIDQSSSIEFFSTKSETDSSDSEMIEEELPHDDTTPQKQDLDKPTPIRTPSHLADFVWRNDSEEEPRYTPDWETDSEGNEDMESSSTSGEFIWQPGDGSSNSAVCPPSTDNTSLEWQLANEKREEEQSQCSPLEDDSESGEEEFTPSTWNRDLTPHRSLLKSPETNSSEKKSVHWKRQRHHRVYEYPPEPQSWHAEVPAQRPRRSWGSHSLDYLTLADWELGGDEFLGDDSEDFEEFFPKENNPLSAPQIYSLGPLTYDNTHDDFYGDGCSFFMGPHASPYAFSSSSFTPAEFFPDDNSAGNYELVYPEEKTNSEEESTEISHVPDSRTKTLSEETKLSREKLRLDLPTLCLSETQSQDQQNENL